MAALVKLVPPGVASTTQTVVPHLKHAWLADLNQRSGERAVLVCRWAQEADGRLFCEWDLEVPADQVLSR